MKAHNHYGMLAVAFVLCAFSLYGQGGSGSDPSGLKGGVSFPPSGLASRIPDVSELWAHAVAAFSRGIGHEPGTVVFSYEELSPEGKLLSRETGRTARRPDGSMQVVYAEKNGKDATEEYRKRFGSRDGRGAAGLGGPPKGFDATPFDPAWQAALTLQPATVKDEGIEVAYTIRNRDVDIRGIVVFGMDGQPLSVRQRYIKMPPFVASIEASIDYIRCGSALFVGRLGTEGRVEALIYRRLFRFIMEFSDWPEA